MAKANELTNASIPFISFVRKGANGEPLRVLKADTSGGGLDIAAAEPAKAPDAVVAALATVAKAADAEAVFFSARTEEQAGALEQVLSTLGFKVDNIHDTEHGTVFMQTAAALPANIIMVELEPGVHMALGGLPMKKADLYCCDPADATNFEAVMGTEGAVPMVNIIMDTLRSTVGASMRQAKTAQEAKANINDALQGAAQYLSRIVELIPLTAFKIEQEMAELPVEGEKAPADAGEGDKPDPAADATVDAAKAAADAAAKKTADTPDPAAVAAATAAADADKPDPAAVAAAAAEAEAKKTAGGLDAAAITAAVLKAVGEQLAPLTAAVKAVDERVAKTETSINGSLIGGRSGEEQTRNTKGDQPANGSDDFNFDTAYRKP